MQVMTFQEIYPASFKGIPRKKTTLLPQDQNYKKLLRSIYVLCKMLL